MARAYAGTVMLEGTTLSEGRGTTRPLELFGAPDIDARAVIAEMQRARAALARRLHACAKSGSSRPSTSMPASCATASTSTPKAAFYDHEAFRPWRLQALAFKAIRRLYPDYDLWRDFPYEYEFGKLAIDVINGGAGAARMGRRCSGEPRRPRRAHRARRSSLAGKSRGVSCFTNVSALSSRIASSSPSSVSGYMRSVHQLLEHQRSNATGPNIARASG